MSTTLQQRTIGDQRKRRESSVAKLHFPEYSIEAALLGLFMVSACLVTIFFELPSSPARLALPSPTARRALTGVAMGLTAIALIYSPWGQRSGAHMNPSVTLTFAWLRKIQPADALFYIAFQFLGAVVGVSLVSIAASVSLADPNVRYAATRPGPAGMLAAAIAEFSISFVHMSAVLRFSNHPRLKRITGLVSGTLVATYIAFESPYSGMSMNPARTFGSALPSGIWQGFAIYLLVPPIAMLAAARLYIARHGSESVACCKLDHTPKVDCIFCGMKGNSDE